MILGHERQIEYLNKVLQRGRLAHAYLLYGPEHVGKFHFAKAVAKALYCKNFSDLSNEGDRCIDCEMIEKDSHPDVICIDTSHTLLSKKEIRSEIPIEDIREIKRILSFAPEGDRWRVVIVNEAEKMSSASRDSFLKLLEEPGAKTLFLLIASDPKLLSSTIVSRTYSVRFSLVPDLFFIRFLEEKVEDSTRRSSFLLLAKGRPGILMRLIRDHKYFEREKKMEQSIGDIITAKNLPDALELSGKVATDEELRQFVFLHIIYQLRKKLFSLSSNAKFSMVLVEKLKKIHSVAALIATTNVNPRLATDVLLLEALSDV